MTTICTYSNLQQRLASFPVSTPCFLLHYYEKNCGVENGNEISKDTNSHGLQLALKTPYYITVNTGATLCVVSGYFG